MKIAVIGANGQLGSDIVAEFKSSGYDVAELTHKDIDVSNIDSASNALKNIKANIIINTAAMHNVEKCELEPELTFAVNSEGAKNLANICNDTGAVLIHISTDYVFDGDKNSPYIETDSTSPLNVYGKTKVAGENFIKELSKKYFIVRTSGIYGLHPCRAKGGLNFAELMLKLAKERGGMRVVDDEFLTPTSTKEVSRQLVKLAGGDNWGLYHASAEGSCSWYEFAKKIFELSGIKTNLEVASPGEFPMKVPRPKYSVLENLNLKNAGINIFKPWNEGLKEYLDSRTG